MIKCQSRRLSSNITELRNILSKSKQVVVLTGAGISAESGVPTFRGSGGLWRNFVSQDLATPHAFRRDPGLVWEFYHYRRELVRCKTPNPGHIALAKAEKMYVDSGRCFNVITQNVDGLHLKAGSTNLVELHGNLYKTRCLVCGDIKENNDSPICPALLGRGAPEFDPERHKFIPEKDLPHCKNPSDITDTKLCGGLLRPHIVWFGECLDPFTMEKADEIMNKADVCLVVGTSAVVYPAAGFAPALAARGVPVAEINLEITPVTNSLGFYFQGKSGDVLPELFDSLQLS